MSLTEWEIATFKRMENKIDILFKMARLVRNTDGLFPSAWGTQASGLLNKLRSIDQIRYDNEVMN